MSRSREGYRAKLNPIFFEVVELNREFETRFAQAAKDRDNALKKLGKTANADLRDKVRHRFEKDTTDLLADLDRKLSQIQSRHKVIPYNPLAYNYFSTHGGTDESKGIREYIHWERHGESAQRTENEIAHGDVKALRRLHRTEEDHFRAVTKQGPIKPFQGDLVHRELLELILCCETKPMSKEERADCADKFCACGEPHDPDALDKQYRRLKKQLEASAQFRK